MFLYPAISPETNAPRKGISLLMVVSMLALFAIVALGFVYYAQSAATASRYARASKQVSESYMEPELALSFFLSRFAYGCGGPDGAGAGCNVFQNALRGHDLATLMYGYNRDHPNNIPYSGCGRLRFMHAAGALAGQDDQALINYTYFETDGIIRDPGYYGTRVDPNNPPAGPYIGSHPSHTYPDVHNMFLAALTADGEIVMQSYHRPWVFDPTNNNALGDSTNQNWTNRIGKYKILRPRPADHLGFPPCEDPGGDVKNLPNALGVPNPNQPGTYYNNDSIWIDIGAPVMQASDGKKFKPLFAALIIPMDNVINLNVHGNVQEKTQGAATKDHYGHQGWGPWEVNLRHVLKDANATDEWKKIFLEVIRDDNNNVIEAGRYGEDGFPNQGGTVAAPGQAPHHYSQVDYDGWGPANSGYVLPGGTGNPAFSAFPLFPSASSRYQNGSVAERTDHPLLYNYFNPAGDDKRFAVGDIEALWRYRDTGSPALSSALFRFCPNIFKDPRICRLVTTHSFDIDRPGAVPWLYANNYKLPSGQSYPTGLPVNSRPINPTPPPSGEFADSQCSGKVAFDRLDINRAIRQYPAPVSSANDIATARIIDSVTYQEALHDRQVLARDIFHRLAFVTMGRRPGDAIAPVLAVGTGEFKAWRWLAQLAVNIVDYRDEDVYITPFNWHPTDRTEFVYGAELPRVVVNELYSEVTGLFPNPLNRPHNVSFWVELLNPLEKDSASPGRYDARLHVYPDAKYPTEFSPYNVVVVDTALSTKLGMSDDALGTPDPRAVVTSVTNFTAPNAAAKGVADVIHPVNKQYSGPNAGNQGFYVLGPARNFPGAGPGVNATLRRQMTGTTDAATYIAANPPKYSVLLRRLACPHLPEQTNKARPLYNPYVTIDYLDNVPSTNGLPIGGGPPPPFNLRRSYGRKQPYSAVPIAAQNPAPGGPGGATQPRNTFFRHNAIENAPPVNGARAGQTLHVPFDWLVHVDRQLISPMELLHVSGVKPYERTQLFGPVSRRTGHYARWFDENTRLFRFFEFVKTDSRAMGVNGKERVPGPIAINGIWDEETFQALCDAQGIHGTQFTTAQVKTLYQALIGKRTPFSIPRADGSRLHIPKVGDRPFLSLATGVRTAADTQMPNSGIANTILRDKLGGNNPAVARIFEVPTDHPYRNMELLTKIYNNVTTRSNVFAVWVTVGFFEVKDDSTQPVKLGAEIGRSNNRHIRHRMFAIIDRTQLGALPSKLTDLSAGGTNTGVTLAPDLTDPRLPLTQKRKIPAVKTVDVAATSGTVARPNWNLDLPAGGYKWGFHPGMTVKVGTETVIIKSVVPNTSITAYFTQNHPVGEPIRLVGTPVRNANGNLIPNAVLGHPGPQPDFDPRRYTATVPYYSLIETTRGGGG